MSAYENRTCSVRGDMHDVSPLVKAVLGIMFQLPKEVRDGVLKEVSTWMVEEQDVVVPSLGWPALLVLGMSVLLTLSVVKEIWAQQQQFQKIQRSDYCKAPASFTMYMWYRFGYWFSWTSGASTIVLGALSLSLLVSGCIVQTILTGCDVNGALWSAWIYTAAPNGGSSGTTVGERIVGAVVSVGGMLIAASLMSVVSSSFEDMLEGFREGRAPVAEGKHIVILGWSPVAPILVDELCKAAELRGGTVITILTPFPKPEVESAIQSAVKHFRSSIITVRKGDRARGSDLKEVCTSTAARVVVLSRLDLSREESDARTINVMLALRISAWPTNGHVVVECALMRNQALIRSVCAGPADVLTVSDFSASLLVRCSQERGIAAFIHMLMGFDGDDLYVCFVHGIAGHTFQEVLLALPEVVVLGYVHHGEVFLLPPMDQTFRGDEKLVLLAEDASTLPREVSITSVERNVCLEATQTCEIPERSLEEEVVIILGWNEGIGAVLSDLDAVVGAGSSVILYNPKPEIECKSFIKDAQKRRRHKIRNFDVQHIQGSLGARFLLEQISFKDASRILVLADKEESRDPDEIDSQTVSLILQVQDILRERGVSGKQTVILPQVLLAGTEVSCRNMGLTDFIEVSQLAAQAIAFACESPEAGGVLTSLISETGCQITIRSLSEYSMESESGVTFKEVLTCASFHGEIVLGWTAPDPKHWDTNPWETNPKDRDARRDWPKSARVVALKGSPSHRSVTDDSSCRDVMEVDEVENLPVV